MKRPLLLDLFSGAGGCAVGYHRAGFDVIGVDIKPMPRYPFLHYEFDAMTLLQKLIDDGECRCGPNITDTLYLSSFAAIHASPPCQAYSRSRNNGTHRDAPKLIERTRAMMRTIGKPFVIENVEGAAKEMDSAVMICGSAFGLKAAGFDLPRHRLFECSHVILAPECSHRRGQTIGVYGNGTNSWHRKKVGRCLKESEKKEAMGIDWMTRTELTQAIPPAYTEFIGRQLVRIIRP